VSHALRSGASAYVLKSENFDGLLGAVKEACGGRQYLSAPLDAKVIREQISRQGAMGPYEELTARERQVLQLAAEGRTSAQIAERLGISRRTAETHRANIYKKLLVDNRTDLVAFALRRGLLTRDA
jgi:DNA-binding NarL/FixJ family response regulator